MSKNKNANQNVHQNNVPVQEEEKVKMEVEENKVNEETEKEKNNVPEHSDQVREIVKKCQEAVNKFDRGWSVKHLEPVKEDIRKMLEENKEKDFLSKSDKNFLYYVNRVIYGKLDTPNWKRNRQEENKIDNRPENLPKQFEFRNLKHKMEELKKVLDGYGNKSIITSIEDLKENKFYCMKETEIDGKMQLECSIKFEQIDGRAETSVMTPEEAFAIRDEYFKIKDLEEERNNISYFVREINNNPEHADKYFEKIALDKEKEAELVNSETIEQDMEE